VWNTSPCQQPWTAEMPDPNRPAASQGIPVAVLCCCTRDPAVRISLLTSGAKRAQPLTSCMPSGGSTSTHVHPRRSPSSRVPTRPPLSACVAVLPCCTAPTPAKGTRTGRDECLTSGNPVHQATAACSPAHPSIGLATPRKQAFGTPLALPTSDPGVAATADSGRLGGEPVGYIPGTAQQLPLLRVD
jgi:hypothetical protein